MVIKKNIYKYLLYNPSRQPDYCPRIYASVYTVSPFC